MLLYFPMKDNKNQSLNCTIFNVSDVHIGHMNSLLTPKVFLSEDAKNDTLISHEQRSASMQMFERNIRHSDIIVFNGDMIDGMIHASPAEKERMGEYFVARLKKWTERYPEKTFYFISGNHDAIPGQIALEKIKEFSQKDDNLFYSDYGVVIGDILFTHGDLQDVRLDLKSREEYLSTIQCYHGVEAEEIMQSQYDFLLEHLEHSPHAKDFIVLRHGGEPSALTAKELKGMHLMCGHSHRPGHMEIEEEIKEEGEEHNAAEQTEESPVIDFLEQKTVVKTVGNTGTMKRHPFEKDGPLNIQTPKDLMQPILYVENGALVRKARAVPAVDSWAGMITQMREDSQNQNRETIWARQH